MLRFGLAIVACRRKCGNDDMVEKYSMWALMGLRIGGFATDESARGYAPRRSFRASSNGEGKSVTC